MIEFFLTIAEHFPGWMQRLGPALGQTLLLTLVSFVVASIMAILLEVIRSSRNIVLRKAVAAYVDVLRSAPILAILYLLYFGLPGVGIYLSAFAAGVIGLGLVYSVYIAEILRAGVHSLHRGQSEAALAVGLSPLQSFRFIVLPQALRAVTPPMLLTLISLLKDTSICALIAVNELMLTSKVIMSESFLPLHVFVVVGLIYFAIAWPMSLFVHWLEPRLNRGRR
jgi:His/Glu/Gln/Arg/opine family amino acid ABC transporter permease subunit